MHLFSNYILSKRVFNMARRRNTKKTGRSLYSPRNGRNYSKKQIYTMYGGEPTEDGEEPEVDGEGNPIAQPKKVDTESEKGPIGLGIDSAAEEIQNVSDYFTKPSGSTDATTDESEEEKSEEQEQQTTPITPPSSNNDENNSQVIELKEKIEKLEGKVEELQGKLETSHEKNVELLERIVEKTEQQSAAPPSSPGMPEFSDDMPSKMPYNESEEAGITEPAMQPEESGIGPAMQSDFGEPTQTPVGDSNFDQPTNLTGSNMGSDVVDGTGQSLVDEGEQGIAATAGQTTPSGTVSSEPAPPSAAGQEALPGASSETAPLTAATTGETTPATVSSETTTTGTPSSEKMGGKSKRRRRTIRKSRKQNKYRYRYVY